MRESETVNKYNPSFKHSSITFLSIIGVISFGLFYLQASLHALLLIALLISACSSWLLYKGDFSAIKNAMDQGISRAFNSIYIFILIGVLIAAFIQSGTIAALIYYGIELMSPHYFLPSGLLLCSIMSLATGTSWGTVATVGVVLMGIGSMMGIPEPLVAGMVISGACFGDKMSPVSDTTNLAAMSAGVKLMDHIRSMLATTTPAFLLSFLIFGYLGLQYANNSVPESGLIELLDGLKSQYTINSFSLLPFIVLFLLSLSRIDAIPSMFAAVMVSLFLALFIQDKSLLGFLNALYSGEEHHSGVATLDNLLNRGGIASMMWTLSLALIALAVGGILTGFGFLRVLIFGLIQGVKRPGSLVLTTIVTCIFGNVIMAEAYMSIILGGDLFSQAYDDRGVDRVILSRSLEDGATLSAALIPWTTAGAFFTSSLGVSVIDYAPYAIFNWLNPLLSISLAYMGVALFKRK